MLNTSHTLNQIQEKDFLSFEYLKSLHDIDEMYGLIEKRHGLKREELFKKIPSDENIPENMKSVNIVLYDEYYLTKVGLMYLEGCIRKDIIDFLEDEILGETNKDFMLTRIHYLFSNILKEKIQIQRKEKGVILKRIIEHEKIEKGISDIESRTGLKGLLIFRNLPSRLRDNGESFSLKQAVNIFLKRLDGVPYSEIDTGLTMNRMTFIVRHTFSDDARSFLPQNTAKKMRQKLQLLIN